MRKKPTKKDSPIKASRVPKIAPGVTVSPALKKQASAGPGIFSNFESAKFSNKRS
jgi:hypothetical protein